MTIKQQGGIFGRNPTFNDLTAGSGSSIEGSGGNVTFSVDRTDASTAGALVLRAANGNLSIDSDGANKDILIRTGGSTERARFYGDSGNFSIKGNLIVDSGQGIDFSATSGTGTSELFDDYEEGTFTPNLLFGGANTGMTYSSQTGLYTKIGNAVVFSIRIVLTAKGSSTGNASISGLPFTAGSTFRGNFSVFHQSVNIDTAGGYYTFCAQPNPSNTTLTLREVGDNISAAAITSSDFSNTSLVDICGTYRT